MSAVQETLSWQHQLLVIGLLMARMLVALSFIPLFVGSSVPTTVRLVFVAGLTLAVLPLALADPALRQAVPSAGVLGLVLKEGALGLVLGLMCGIAFWGVHAAGSIVEYQAGLTVATAIDPLTGQEDSIVGGLFMNLFTLLFLATGGLLALIGMLLESYTVWPLSSMTPVVGNLKLVAVVIGGLGELLLIALKVAVPFVILMLVVEIALGLLSRFAPQLNVFFLSLPLKMIVLTGLILLYATVMTDGLRGLPVTDFGALLLLLRKATDG
ncbi:type III secretion system export apparatus subunit SctT [Aquabacterium sp. A7-Y]|uniref:type III secretion system export apparatus subunit SctT n=1 Tax=Aquabacterium sp. A7-Y TaxID=1349605 RepID=UPI00223E7BD4|nr:type III secretion system export apparatus subunit SctT [Aquabacterium sp. A7-Y]MCW7539741.1 type III secretion system export apparatus subunit SctT [Aquabacterium sp. A7-Y]